MVISTNKSYSKTPGLGAINFDELTFDLSLIFSIIFFTFMKVRLTCRSKVSMLIFIGSVPLTNFMDLLNETLKTDVPGQSRCWHVK